MRAPGANVLEVAGPQADHIGDVWDVFFAVSVVVTVLILVFTVAAAIRSNRHRRAEGDDSDPLYVDAPQERRLHGVIIAATAATVITLIVMLVASIRAGHAMSVLDDRTPDVTIRLTGHQWWWQVEYEASATSQPFTTANEIHVPVGKLVRFHLRSSDVIHSLWLPSLDGKRDLIPGRENQMTIRVDRAGTYRGQCAEFCGAQHAKMEILLVAESEDAFAAWRAQQIQPAAPPHTPSELRGREIFLTSSCVMCHSLAGTPAGAGLGPDLTHVASRQTLGAGVLPMGRDELARWILNPQAHKPAVRMPAQSLNHEDLENLLDYLESLR